MVSGIQTLKKLSQKARSLVKKRQTTDQDDSNTDSTDSPGVLTVLAIIIIALLIANLVGIPLPGTIQTSLGDIKTQIDNYLPDGGADVSGLASAAAAGAAAGVAAAEDADKADVASDVAGAVAGAVGDVAGDIADKLPEGGAAASDAAAAADELGQCIPSGEDPQGCYPGDE